MRRPPLLYWTFALIAAGVAALFVHTGAKVDFGATGNEAVETWDYTAIEVLGTALVWWRVVADRRNRPGWSCLALYATLWTVADLGWTLHYDHLDEAPFPNWTDAVYITSDLFAYAGLMLLLRERVRPFRASSWLDGLVGGLALGALCAALFLGPVIQGAEGPGIGVVVTLAYPVFDLLLLCFVGIAFGVSGWRPGGMWSWLGACMIVSAVGDAAYSYQEAVGTYTATSWTNCTWPLAMAMFAWAAWRPSARARAAAEGGTVFVVPAIFAGLSIGVLLWSQFHNVPLLASFAAAGSLLAGGARAYLTNRENLALLRRTRSEALTDNLTGLGNRRRLMGDLDDALAGARDGEPATLVFFDLDGFKGYNDTFGHGAGDALLVRLGDALAHAAAGVGAAYRLGGDEFCVLFEHDARPDDPEVVRCVAALSDEGEGFRIGASHGLVRLPADAETATVALQLADERMYDDKDSRRGSPRRQARDLLLQVLKERQPDLEEHVDDVGALAVAVGKELGLATDALDELARGAELHDIGKLAVPDTILRKPGPLDEVEWQVMRQHTIVGERILAAAPALREVAKLVRSSHERWDGGGYPDGLRGEQIPLGARIIAVCDAFDAMRQRRPYADSLPETVALAELRRCAGTQFDPRVIEAFAAVLAQGAAQQLRVA
jgi:diguanylate cyclase (GGDEF)-like protein